MIDVLVADDERPALDELAHLLRADSRIGEIVTASSGAAALSLLSERVVAIAFLDIHMPGLDGIDLAAAVRRLAVPPAIVFVTADDARAVDAFELRAVDYLLKPVRIERLRAAVDRAIELSRAGAAGSGPAEGVGQDAGTGGPALPGTTPGAGSGTASWTAAGTTPGTAPGASAPASAGASAAAPGVAAGLSSGSFAGADDEVLPVTVGSTVRFVRRRDVRWVQAQGDYSRLHTGEGAGYLVRIPISELEQRWTGAGFVRVHRSYLVSVPAIGEARLTGGEPTVTVGDVALPVSRRLLPGVREALVRGSGRGREGGTAP